MAFAEHNQRHKAASAAAVIICHAIIAYILISGLNLRFAPAPSEPLAVFDAPILPPPPVEEVIPPKAEAKEREGAASPPNLEAQASPVVAPDPEVKLAVPPPVVAAPVPREGADRAAGAAPVPGRGTGAGGTGNGTGSGGAGSGTGSGTGPGGAPVRRARLVDGELSLADYPRALRRAGIGGRVEVHMTVEPSGRVSRCRVVRSSGSPELDAITCRLVQARYRFDPARDAQGRPVPDLVGESHNWMSRRRGQ